MLAAQSEMSYARVQKIVVQRGGYLGALHKARE